jgi:hypothetical protein
MANPQTGLDERPQQAFDKHMTNQDAEQAYAEGRWCGECRYGVAEDPPCCEVSLLALAAVDAS